MSLKKKTCELCDRDIYAKGKCQFHYWADYNKKRSIQNKPLSERNKPLSPSSGYKIPPRSKKRLNDDIQYLKIKLEIEQEAIDSKNFKCYFCDKDVKGKVDYHHIEGRDGDLFTDKDNIVRTHPECHFQYHHQPVSKILWFLGFVDRLRESGSKMYWKENNKLTK